MTRTFFVNWMSRYGVSLHVTTRRHFELCLFKHLNSLAGTTNKCTTAYHSAAKPTMVKRNLIFKAAIYCYQSLSCCHVGIYTARPTFTTTQNYRQSNIYVNKLKEQPQSLRSANTRHCIKRIWFSKIFQHQYTFLTIVMIKKCHFNNQMRGHRVQPADRKNHLLLK